MAGLVDETGQGGLVRREVEVAGTRLVASVVVVAAVLEAEFEVVLTPNPVKSTWPIVEPLKLPPRLPDPRRFVRPDATALERLTGEVEHGECELPGTFCRPILDGQSWSTYDALVHVAEAVVAEVCAAEQRGSQRVVVRHPHHGSRGVLILVDVGRRSRRR